MGTVSPAACAVLRDSDTMTQSVTIRPVPLLDAILRVAARALSKVSSVTDAGAFHYRGGAAFLDAWRDGPSLTVRLGRVELVVGMKRMHTASKAA